MGSIVAAGPPSMDAKWLAPSAIEGANSFLYNSRPFAYTEFGGQTFGVFSKYADVMYALRNGKSFSRTVPLPEDEQHDTLHASWGLNDEEHAVSRSSLRSLQRGLEDEVVAFISERTAELTSALASEQQPWNMARVIYQVSAEAMGLLLGSTVYDDHIDELRLLTRTHVAASGGFLGIRRDLRAEEILDAIIENPGSDGLAARLVGYKRRGKLTPKQVRGQLWLLCVSAETQATLAASTLGMLYEFGLVDYARGILDDDEAMDALVEEGGRRSRVFPASLATTLEPFPIGKIVIPPFTPCFFSYGGANMDPDVYEDPARFDPRRAFTRSTRHIAFGVGDHLCQGERMSEQFSKAVLQSGLATLPANARLRAGKLRRELSGISLSVADLPFVRN